MRAWPIILVLAVGGTYLWSRRDLDELARENARIANAERAEAERLKVVESDLDRLKKQDDARDESTAARVAAVRAKIAEKESEIAGLDAEISRRKNAGIDTTANRSLLAEIDREKKVLAGIDRDLAEARDGSRAAKTANRDVAKREQATWTEDRDAREAAIDALSTKIAEENARLKELRARRFDFSAKQEADALARGIADEKASLAGMRSELKSAERERKARRGSPDDAAVRAKTIAEQTLADLTERRRAEAAKLEVLNRELAGVTKSEGAERADLGSIERDRAARSRELEALKTELRDLEGR